jgi:hypothetical protein
MGKDKEKEIIKEAREAKDTNEKKPEIPNRQKK